MKLEIEHKMSTGAGFKSSSEDYDKSIMEYKTMQELDKLNDNKSGFRDWKVRMKDGMVSCLKTSSFMSIMEWIENPNTVLTGEETLDEIMQKAEDEAGIPKHEPTYSRLDRALKSILMQKSENKTESFTLTKRAKTGWGAWHEVHKWYMVSSGQKLTDRMSNVMQPPQAKKDSDVMYEVAKWKDEYKECLALGASELGYDYLLTAIKRIAIPFIKKRWIWLKHHPVSWTRRKSMKNSSRPSRTGHTGRERKQMTEGKWTSV